MHNDSHNPSKSDHRRRRGSSPRENSFLHHENTNERAHSIANKIIAAVNETHSPQFPLASFFFFSFHNNLQTRSRQETTTAISSLLRLLNPFTLLIYKYISTSPHRTQTFRSRSLLPPTYTLLRIKNKKRKAPLPPPESSALLLNCSTMLHFLATPGSPFPSFLPSLHRFSPQKPSKTPHTSQCTLLAPCESFLETPMPAYLGN